MISLLQEVIPGETRWKGYRIFLYYFLQMQVYNYGKIIFKKVKNYSEIQFLKYFKKHIYDIVTYAFLY